MRTTLEEERRALLEQIEASRAVYRRMLSGSSGGGKGISHSSSAIRRSSAVPTIAADFPRSYTMRWIIAHRWQLAIGITAGIIFLGSGRKLASQPAVVKVRSKVRAIRRIGAVQSAIATGTRLLRSRNSLHLAGRIAGLLLRWMQQQRTQQKFIKK